MARKWDDILIEKLKNKKEALAYLNAALEDTRDGSKESQQVLLSVLKDIAKAQGGFGQLSEKTGLGRESLYKTLSPRGNPKLTTLMSVISEMGFELKANIVKK